MKQFNDNTKNSYWVSVLIFGGVFGTIFFILPLLMGYLIIGAESSQSAGILVIFIISFCLACFIGILGGFTSVWHYSKNPTANLTLGKGALIGFLTGVIIIFVETLLTNIWLLIDPDYMVYLRDNVIAIIETTNLPEAQKQAQIDSVASMFQPTISIANELLSLLIEVPIFGLLNLITGMIGVKVFVNKENS